MKIIFLSDDGVQFDNEIDCLIYESNVNIESKYDALYGDLKFYDCNGYELFFNAFADEIGLNNFYNTVNRIEIKSPSAAEVTALINDEFGWYLPTEVGKWCYSYHEFEWTKVG